MSHLRFDRSAHGVPRQTPGWHPPVPEGAFRGGYSGANIRSASVRSPWHEDPVVPDRYDGCRDVDARYARSVMAV